MTNNLRCNHCDKEFRYESEKKRHELSHSPHFKCSVCNKKFSFISALKRHEKQHQRTEKALCKQCGRSFRDETLLKRHIQYSHKGKYTCNKCNTEFHSDVALKIHEKVHKPKSERKYHCSYDGCEKTFNFPHHLKHHEMTHTDTKQHHCHVCRKGFIQLHHLKVHLKTHEPENWVHCTEANCKKAFPTEYSKKRHLLNVHNTKLNDTSISDHNQIETNVKNVVEDKTVLCTTCGNIMDQYMYEDHKSKCAHQCNETSGSLSIAILEARERDTIANNDNSPNINDCNAVLGGCIVSKDSSENCLCAQIKTTVDDYYDNNIVPDENVNSTTTEPTLQSCEPYKSYDEQINASCGNCACSGILNSDCSPTNILSMETNRQNIEKRHCPKYKLKTNVPDIEYKIDGSIKLRDTFDPDIEIFENDDIKKKNTTSDNKNSEKAEQYNSFYVPFNSCKDVLGKCIVSGNGTISDECLCAKMLIDEQQVNAEEIEEITPYPAGSCMNLSVI